MRERRRGERRRQQGAGPKHRLVFVDRVLVTLVKLRHDLPDAALAEPYGVDRSTISGAIRQIRPLPAARGFAALSLLWVTGAERALKFRPLPSAGRSGARVRVTVKGA